MKKWYISCAIGVVIIFFISFSSYADKQKDESLEYIYSSKKMAIEEGLKKTLDEWTDMNLTEKETILLLDSDEVDATYKTNQSEYCMAYIICSTDEMDYLDYFIVRIGEKNNLFSFSRVSAFYGLIPDDCKEAENNRSECIGGEILLQPGSDVLKFYCIKLKDNANLYIDGRKIDENKLKQIREYNVKPYGIIDKKAHEIVFE